MQRASQYLTKNTILENAESQPISDQNTILENAELVNEEAEIIGSEKAGLVVRALRLKLVSDKTLAYRPIFF